MTTISVHTHWSIPGKGSHMALASSIGGIAGIEVVAVAEEGLLPITVWSTEGLA